MDENFDSTMALLATEIPNVPLLNTTFSLVDEKNSFIVQGSMEAKPRGILKTTNVENSVQVPSLYNKLESNDKENYSGSPAFVRSPARKINSPFKKPDIKSEMKASPMRKFPALVARLGLDEDGDDSTSSIVDVNNDQIFDNSIFTEYDEKDLSIMSEKISVKFRTVLRTDGKKKKNKQEASLSYLKKPIDETMLLLNESKYDQSSNDKSDIDEEILNIEKVKRNLDFDGSTEISNQKEKTFEENSASQEVIVDPERISEDSFTSRVNDSFKSERRDSTESTCSDWFNTTREEMILYEKFGEDYDVIVERMSHEEKVLLKEEISKAVPKEVHELLANPEEETPETQEGLEENIHELELDNLQSPVFMVDETPNVSQLSEKIITAARENRCFAEPINDKKAPIPLPRTLTPQKNPNAINIHEECSPSVPEKPMKDSNSYVPQTVDYHSPSKANLFKRRYFKPVANENSPNSRASPDARGASYHSPLKIELTKRKYFKSPATENSPSYLKPTTASKQRASSTKNSHGYPSLETNPCTRGNYCSVSPSMQPRQAFLKEPAYKKCLVNMTKIVSPVAQYIQTSTAPKLIRNIKPKAAKYLEDEILAIQERNIYETDEANKEEQQKKNIFKPLPEAEYRSSKVALEKELPTKTAKDLPKKFMTENSTEAVIVRHLGRQHVSHRVIENWSSCNDPTSPARGGVRMKNSDDTSDSIEIDSTSVDMSIREVKKIQKLVPSLSRRQLN